MTDDRVAQFWSGFVAAGGPDVPYTAWFFGADDDPAMQTRLALLVLAGPKRATTGLLAEYEREDEPLPRPGDHSVILDGDGTPRGIIVSTGVEIRPFGEVDDDFAWTEGEGDRSLAWWRRAHREYFERSGFIVDEATPMVLERFDLVWPAPREAGAAGSRLD
jgi:uncharacterized protein YhfF